MVTAIASPAGRLLNSCMPIQATPDSVSPIHTPLPRIRNSAAISSPVMAMSLMPPRRCASARARVTWAAGVTRCAALVAIGLHTLATQFEHQFVDEGDQQDERADRHRQLRNPQRRGVVAGGDVVELAATARPAARCRRPTARPAASRRTAPRSPCRGARRRAALQQQRHADVLAALERVRQRQEAGRRHHVAGIGIGAGHVEVRTAGP